MANAGNTPNPSGAASHKPQTAVPELLTQISFLAGLPRSEVLDVLRSSTDFLPIHKDTVLTKQDNEADYLYYIVQGKVRLERKRPSADDKDRQVNVVERSIGPGTLIGRFALVYNLPYTSQTTAETDVLVLRFRTSALERLLYRFPNIRSQIVPQATINRLRTLPIFREVEPVTLSYVAEDVQTETYAADDLIYSHDRPADHLYLINTGQVTVYHPRLAEKRLRLGTGGAFGFPGSIGPGPASTTHYGHWVQATAPTVLYKLPWKSIDCLARRYPGVQDPQIQFMPFETLREVSVFKDFSDEQKRKLAGFCSFQHMPQHHMILQQGDIGDSMWILLAGGKAIISALEQNTRALPRIPVDGVFFFHETALLTERNVRSTVETEPGSLWLRLHWQDFRRFLQEEGEQLMQKLNIPIPEDETIAGTTLAQDFDWLGKGEALISYNHRHWIALLDKLRWPVVSIVMALLLALLFNTFIPAWWLGWGAALAVPVIIIFVWGIIDYYNDYFIVTNRRIIQQEKVILTKEFRREALLEQIERVDVQTSFWGNVLKYGTLKIFTAGTTGFIEFDLVPAPDELKAIIFRESNLRKMRYRAESRLEIQNALEQRLGITMSLPSRVRSPQFDQQPTDPKLTGWQRFWRTMRTRELKQISADRTVWRKHWLILLREITVPLFLLLLLMAIMLSALLSSTFGWLESLQNFVLGFELLLIIPFLLLFGWVAYTTIDWWNDFYEVTKDRIVDVEKLPFFLKELRREAQLAQIQDVTYRISSPVEMLFNYGNVEVQTAASQGSFTFTSVPDPRGVKEEINRRIVEWRRQDELRKVREQVHNLPDWFELYNRLEAGQEPTRLIE